MQGSPPHTLAALKPLRRGGASSVLAPRPDRGHPLRTYLERKAIVLGLAHAVELHEGIPIRPAGRNGRRRVEAMVLPSADGRAEGIPVAAMEAMGRGLPVIATDSRGTRQVLVGAGFTVPNVTLGIGGRDDQLASNPRTRATRACGPREGARSSMSTSQRRDSLTVRSLICLKGLSGASTSE